MKSIMYFYLRLLISSYKYNKIVLLSQLTPGFVTVASGRPISTRKSSASRLKTTMMPTEAVNGQLSTPAAASIEWRGPVVIRRYDLYNRCSDGLLIIGHRGINASGQPPQSSHSMCCTIVSLFSKFFCLSSYLRQI
jgi:hypothetical protein